MRAVAASLLVLIGCSKQAENGLPPATEWQSNDPVASAAEAMPSRPHTPGSDPHGMIGGGGGADPHAGVPGAPPIGGGGGADPHAGVPGAPPIGDMPHQDPNAPHGGVGAAVDVTQLGLSSPDPNRPIDPSRHIKGQLKANAKVQARLQPGATVFLMVRKLPAGEGQPPGSLIAVDRVTWTDNLKFELTEKHAMVAGAPDLIGELIVMARVDQDQDAMTKQPGDVTGMARVKIPANGVVLELDTILQ